MKKNNSLWIKNGRVIDPANHIDDTLDILVENGIISKVAIADDSFKADVVIDAKGQVVCPGLVDMHVHFREPGQEYKETIETGLKAAAMGGFTGVLCMPNTEPAIDNEGTVHFVSSQGKRYPYSNLWIAGAVTYGRKGERMTEMALLKEAGVLAISDDGSPIATAGLLKNVLEYSSMLDLLVIDHCEDHTLTAGGVMNEGFHSTINGLKGIPELSEDVIVARDILISENTKVPMHLAHISTAGAVNQIRQAHQRGVQITAETAPHYTILTDEDVKLNPNFKMYPPLRNEKARDMIIEGLIDNTLSIIATDHAPHQVTDKQREFDQAPFGIIGLETSLAVTLKSLYHSKIMSLSEIIQKMSYNPAKLLKVDRGTLSVGKMADITIFDPDYEWNFDYSDIGSKSQNTPFLHWDFKGKVTHTIVGGVITMQNSELMKLNDEE